VYCRGAQKIKSGLPRRQILQARQPGGSAELCARA
jgi:hypothetical protein